MQRAVYLDRDGVLNRAVVRDGRPYPPASLAELEILPGVPEALVRLRSAGFRLVVVTNQPDVARGTTSRREVEAINDRIRGGMHIDEFRTCYHDAADGCDCRKPAPGAILAAAHAHGIDLGASFMVGDRWRDVQAGQRAGCRTVFIDYGYAEPRPEQADFTVSGLPEAAQIILGAHR